jgi:hypothetical protein
MKGLVQASRPHHKIGLLESFNSQIESYGFLLPSCWSGVIGPPLELSSVPLVHINVYARLSA